MGWDVVQIGLQHNLPIYDPFATAKEVAKRMKQNIRLVYFKECKCDMCKNVADEIKGYELIELGKFEANDSGEYLRMKVLNYDAYQIRKTDGINDICKDEYAKLILDNLKDEYDLYEIEDDEESFSIRIFKENVNLDVYYSGRWGYFEKAFHHSEEYQERLNDYRIEIYNQAKLFGCNEVIICSDQGPTQTIYDNMDYSADDLKEYARSFKYLNDSSWVKDSEKDDWKKHAKHIMFSSVFRNQFTLSDEDWVEVIYDDFADIINEKD